MRAIQIEQFGDPAQVLTSLRSLKGEAGAAVVGYLDLIGNRLIDGFDIGVHVAGSNPPNPGSDGRNERITLRGSRIVNNASMGFLGACDGCVRPADPSSMPRDGAVCANGSATSRSRRSMRSACR